MNRYFAIAMLEQPELADDVVCLYVGDPERENPCLGLVDLCHETDADPFEESEVALWGRLFDDVACRAFELADLAKANHTVRMALLAEPGQDLFADVVAVLDRWDLLPVWAPTPVMYCGADEEEEACLVESVDRNLSIVLASSLRSRVIEREAILADHFRCIERAEGELR